MLDNSQIGLVPLNWKYSPDRIDSYLEGIVGYGFEGIQISSDQGQNPDFVRKALDLKIKNAEHYIAIRCTPNGVVSGHMEEYLEQVKFAAEHSVEMLVLAVDGSLDREKIAGRVRSEDAMSDKGLHELAQTLTEIAEVASQVKVASSFHPHAATYIETPAETDALYTLIDANLISVCLDVGHWIVGGGDPVAATRKFGSKIGHVHVKDVSQSVLEKMLNGGFETMEDAVVQEKLFVPAGTGALDLPELMRALSDVGYKGWLMSEQDSAFEPSEEASKISMHNIKKALNK